LSDIRKRTGAKGTTYQVRYPSKATKTGYAYATFASRKEALEFREQSHKYRNHSAAQAGIRTVEGGLQKWLDVCEHEGRNGRHPVTEGTLKHYEWRRDHILLYDWKKDLQELTTPDVVEFRSWLLRTYSRDVAGKLLTSFHSMVLELVTRGILTHDIVTGVSIHTATRHDEPVAIPTEREIQHLLATADQLANSKNKQIQDSWERYRPMLYLAADSGMRPQEYIVLPHSNLTKDGVKVDRALETGGRKIATTKTPAGRRFIPLSPHVLEMISHYRENNPVPSAYNLVFPTSSGHWQSPDNWRARGFYYACEQAGLVETVEENGRMVERAKYSPYDLRHFYASMLIEQRVSLKRIQRLMGHEKIETTLNVYGHVIERVEGASEERTGMLASLHTIQS
jgi:integrase